MVSQHCYPKGVRQATYVLTVGPWSLDTMTLLGDDFKWKGRKPIASLGVPSVGGSFLLTTVTSIVL